MGEADNRSSRHENYRYSFIWDFENYKYLIEKSIETLKDKFSLGDNVINFLFPTNITDKVKDFLKELIVKNHDEEELLSKVFNVITYSYSNERLYFLAILIEHINNIEIIQSLELIQNFKSGSSLIPFYEADKKFWKEFEELLSHDVKFLKLKLWTKQKQICCDRTIEWHRKRDFVSDF